MIVGVACLTSHDFIDQSRHFPYLTVMALREILIIPDPLLRKKAKPITSVDRDLRLLADDMLETMYDAPGIGLAAPQIGVMQRLVVADVSKSETDKEPLVLVNPEIVWMSEEINVYEEGCLSIPEYYEEVKRPAACRVRYLDIDGKERELECGDLLATCVQHEIDHLNGVLFIDHISRLKRERVVKKFTKAKKRANA